VHQPSTIARPQLEERLDGALQRRVTCVIAGAGFGKTTLLAAWAATVTSVWLGLGPADRTLTGLVRGLTDVLRARVPGLPPELVAAVRASQGPDTGGDERGRAQAYAAGICTALAAAQPRDLVLVLDDLEVLDGVPDAAAFVAGLCRQAPPALHVVLASRHDPPFPVARLRGQGQVLDLTAIDLAFTPEETRAVVEAAVGDGTADLAAELHRLSAGWPAAVRLASEALAHEPPGGRRGRLDRLRRPGGLLHDYLAEEALASEPEPVRDLLRRLAVLDRFTLDLAEALGPPGAAAALPGLVRRGLVMATPGGEQAWLSVNALVRGVLAELGTGARQRDAATTITAAVRWFEDHGRPADALRCALATAPRPTPVVGGADDYAVVARARAAGPGAGRPEPGEGHPGEPGEGHPGEPGEGHPGEPGEGHPGEPGERLVGDPEPSPGDPEPSPGDPEPSPGDPEPSPGDPDEVRRLVTRWGARLLAEGDAGTVIAALARLGTGDRPAELALLEGQARQLAGDWDGALACFERAAPADGPLPPGLAWRVGLIHHLRGDLDAALATYSRGDLSLTAGEPVDQALLVAWTATAHWLRGEGASCRTLAVDAMARARRSGDDRALAAAHTVQALVAADEGDRLANDSHYVRALDHAERAGDLLQIIRIRLNRGSRLNEEGFYEGAVAELGRAIGLADLGGYAVLRAIALGNRGESRRGLGQLEMAVDDLEAAKAIFQRQGSSMVGYALAELATVHSARGQTALARAALTEAADVSRKSGDVQGLVPALARLARLVAPEDPAAASELAAEAVARGPGLNHVEALVAQGWVLTTLGDHEAADRVSRQALGLARERRDRAGQAEGHELLAAIASTSGDAEARAHLNEALTLWEELRSPLGQGRVLLALARLGGADTPRLARRAERLLRPLGARRLAEESARLGSAPRPAPAVAIHCLGGFAVLRYGVAVPLAEWKSRKARDLVKILIARDGRPVHRSVLLELLWPDEPPERTASRLSVTLSTARAVLDRGKTYAAGWFLVADSDTVVLDPDHVEVDVLRFLDMASQALAQRKDGPSPAALEALAEAEAAYVGDAFPEDPYEDWAVSLRERARAAYTSVARTFADDAAAAGDTAAAVRCYLRVLEHDAFDERAHVGLVAAQLAAGQQGEARRSYRTYCARMDELGVEAAPFPAPRRPSESRPKASRSVPGKMAPHGDVRGADVAGGHRHPDRRGHP
jgi:ATP/maltotriose-dependent transcriptional regulator MalT/DNA-binding SARP family transcriptional activator